MTPAQRLTKIVDFFYIRPVRAVIPLQTFRYAICGGVNLGLNWVLYAVLYNFILDKEIVRLGFVAIFSLYRGVPGRLSDYSRNRLLASETYRVQVFTAAGAYATVPLPDQRTRVGVAELPAAEIFCQRRCTCYPTPSQAVTSLLIIGYSYLMQKYFTFRGCES